MIKGSAFLVSWSKLSMLSSSSQILATQPVENSLSAHVQLNVPGSPHVTMLRTQAVGMKSLQVAEWPADLAPVRFNC
jgi:hypothetical protein